MDYTPKFSVEIYHDLAPHLAGISSKEFFQDTDKLIEAWKITTQWTLDTFHGRLTPRKPTAAPNSYAHLVCLGAPLHYSDTAEPNITAAADSLEDAVKMLEDAQGMDFSACPLFQQYADVSRKVKEVFPDSPVLAGLGYEGPVTSAALFRGDGFYYDIMDEPELAAKFLSLMTDSVLAFKAQLNTFCGLPGVGQGGGYLADDLASMIPPSMWDELVVPFWKQYYAGATLGSGHSLHCEALVPAHLPYLAKAGVTHYQPSVSPQLTLESVRANTDLPFDWLLYAYQVTEMDDQQLADWIAKAVSFQPTRIRTQFGAYAAGAGKIDRILAFMDIADTYTKA